MTIALTATGVAFSVIWNLMGRPEPLSRANVQRAIRIVREQPAKRRTAKLEQERRTEEERIRRERTEAETKLKAALRSAVVRLNGMECGGASYHPTEWKLRKNLCKDAVFAIVQYKGYHFDHKGSNWDNAACINYDTDTIIIHITKSRWRKRTLQLCVLIHPSSTLTFTQYGWPEVFGGSATVLSAPLAPADLITLGWSFPDDWEAWNTMRIPGHSQPEHMTPDIVRERQVRDWDPDSPFAGTKLPD